MKSYLLKSPGRGALSFVALMKALDSINKSWSMFCHEVFDYISWYEERLDPKLSNHTRARQWKFERKTPSGDAYAVGNVETSYRMAAGFVDLNFSFVGEILRAEPSNAKPEVMKAWANGGKESQTKAAHITHAKKVMRTIEGMHELKLKMYGYPPPVGRQLAIREWQQYMDELPDENGRHHIISHRATWPEHWSCTCALVSVTVSTDLSQHHDSPTHLALSICCRFVLVQVPTTILATPTQRSTPTLGHRPFRPTSQ
jgi:hypothetical protein